MSGTTNSSARNRILSLLDENSFVEIGRAVTARSTDFNLQDDPTPSDGVITGYGVIEGNLVYVYSQDAQVLNGTIGEMHARKITKMYDMAMKMGAPVIGLIDCAGMRLQEATDALNGFGEIYAKKALASGLIPQVDVVFGTCGGGMTVATAMSDFTFMAEEGKLFLNSPDAVTGNKASTCNTAGVAFQSQESGLADVTGDEATVIAKVRELISVLPGNNEEVAVSECSDDLNRACAGIETVSDDAAKALAMIADNYRFVEVKEAYAKGMVTGFLKLNGMTVGAVANRTALRDEEAQVTESFDPILTTKGCNKATDFVNFCDAFGIPVLTLTNVKGFASCMCAEKNLAKAVARLTYAFANATVPKVNVIVGEAMGSAYLTMNSKSVGADLVYAWEDAKIGMMDAQLAAKILYAKELEESDNSAALLREKTAEYEKVQSGVENAARRGYVDTIIAPADTRKYVIGAFEMLYTKRDDRPAKKHGAIS